MTRRLALLAVFLAGPLVQHVEAQARGQETFLTRAIFVDGEVWVLADAGQLFWITAGSHRHTRERLPEPARDLCLLDGRPAVLTCPTKGCAAWTLRVRRGSTWSVAATVPRAGDRLLGLLCDTPKPQVLTTRRLITLDQATPGPVVLSEAIAPVGVVSLHGNASEVFVGINHGEFGGGLRRIDRANGHVRRIERNSTGELCGGPLNTECDPVTGVAALPGRPECVVAAIGLHHFRPRGRLVEVCGDTVRQLYAKPHGGTATTGQPAPDDVEPGESVAFFGLAGDGETLWSAGTDGVYRLDRNGVHMAATMPRFEKVGPFDVSFAVPGVALVLTRVNQRSSISGAVPMLAPRVSTQRAPGFVIRTGTLSDFGAALPICIEAHGDGNTKTMVARIGAALRREFKDITISCSATGERLGVSFHTGFSAITHSKARGPRNSFAHVAVVRDGGFAAEAEINDDSGETRDDAVRRFSDLLIAFLKSATHTRRPAA